MSTTLAELKVGQKARVISLIKGASQYRQRLLAMGLVPGTEFEVIRRAPMGDPIEIRLRRTALCLRHQECIIITVELI